MARTVRDARLETRAAREKLKPSGKPYYRTLDPGLHIGYRKGVSGGRWVMRRYDGAYRVETMATADDKSDADGVAVLSYRQALERVRELHVGYTRIAQGLPATDGPYTVRHCVNEYLDWLDRNRKSGRDARWRAEALILPELGEMVCAELTAPQLRQWRDSIADQAARLRTRKGQEQKFREVDDDTEAPRRRKATANRTLTILKAGLNRAWREGRIASDDAWRRVEPFAAADAARVRYLNLDECRRLINAAESTFRDLVRAALATGCRYGELAALQVRDFNRDVGTLHIRASKTGKDRHVVLNDEGRALFERLTAGRPGVELVLRKADGDRWGKSNQDRLMVGACAGAKIAPPASFHVLRHSWASHAVMAGAPLMVAARNLGHADTRMVEKHYGHLSESYVADEIRRTAPRFGALPDDGKVTPLTAGR